MLGFMSKKTNLLDSILTENMEKKKSNKVMVPNEIIMSKIYFIRNQKVMLDRDLAELYEVDTKVLKQAVKRNMDIFPEHFMFEMTEKEFKIWRSQFVTSKSDMMGLRYAPFCFSEHGVLQLANVVRSRRARQMSIRIIEVFIRLQKMLTDNVELRLAVEKLERKTENNSKNIEIVFRYLEELLETQENPAPQTQIGFKR